MKETVMPYYQSIDKSKEVADMFDHIAPKYDLLNHLLSAGIDIYWRKVLVKSLQNLKIEKLLDVATGTGDLALACLALQPKKIIGIDISKGMLEHGVAKISKKESVWNNGEKREVSDIIELRHADSQNLPFDDNYFDVCTVAFGVRNFANLEIGLSEMLRVTKEGGKIAILEFSKPSIFPIKQLFQFYFRYILPLIGKWFSKDNRAYSYLPESVAVFPQGQTMLNILQNIGYKNTKANALTFGICTLYTGLK